MHDRVFCIFKHSHAGDQPNINKYCEFENFRENFSSANSFKGHISGVGNSRLRRD